MSIRLGLNIHLFLPEGKQVSLYSGYAQVAFTTSRPRRLMLTAAAVK